MQVLSRNSLRDQAGEALRAGIVTGELAPGGIYSATALAERLGVSPTPVREAMLDLASSGLVEPIRNRGYRILTVEEHDLDEISELRQMLEVPAMRQVVERASDDEIAALGQSVDDIARAAERDDVSSFLAADRRFHLGLLELTGNGRLVKLVEQLRDQTRLSGINLHLASSVSEHRDVFEAVRARDSDRAERLMRRHLIHTRGVWAGKDEPAVAADAAADAQPLTR